MQEIFLKKFAKMEKYFIIKQDRIFLPVRNFYSRFSWKNPAKKGALSLKNQLRQYYKQLRKQLSLDAVKIYSAQIAARLFTLPLWQASNTVMLYLSFQNEVSTTAIYQKGWQLGKNMLLPICQPQTGQMKMSRITSLEQLVYNRYGIGELPDHLQQIIAPEQIDLCLIPGIAFDHQGNRLGFGAGYYDRYLALLRPEVKRLALAYECQLHPQLLPTDEHDLPMDYILTERQLYQISR